MKPFLLASLVVAALGPAGTALAAPPELSAACRKELFGGVASAAACQGAPATRTMVVLVGTGTGKRAFLWSRLDGQEVLYACEAKEGCSPPEKKGPWAMVPAAAVPPVEVLTYVRRPAGLVRLGRESIGKVPRLDQTTAGVKRDAKLSECVKAWSEGDKALADLKSCAGTEAAIGLSAIVKKDPGKEPRFTLVRRPPPPTPPVKPTDPPASLICLEQDRGQWFRADFVGCLLRLLTTEALTTRLEPDPYSFGGSGATAADGGAPTPARDGGAAVKDPARTAPSVPPR